LNAEIEISINQNKLLVVVTHDGKGITNETIKRLSESSKGIGLRSILGRAQLINATVQYAIVGSDKSKIIVETPLS
jgi:signal transduction histidine kinase